MSEVPLQQASVPREPAQCGFSPEKHAKSQQISPGNPGEKGNGGCKLVSGMGLVRCSEVLGVTHRRSRSPGSD